MADIELVIKIPEKHFKKICANKEDAIIAHDICRRIANGTPLPEPCEDAVSREFMYKLGAKCIAARNENGTLVSIASIESLPSVNPRQKTGKWIVDDEKLEKQAMQITEIFLDIANKQNKTLEEVVEIYYDIIKNRVKEGEK